MKNLKLSFSGNLSIISIVFLLFIGCKKNNDSSGGKAYLSVTNAAHGALPVDVLLGGNKITTSGQLSFDSTTGLPGNPYLQVPTGIHNFKVTPDGNTSYIDGNISFQANQYYSLFIYDSV